MVRLGAWAGAILAVVVACDRHSAEYVGTWEQAGAPLTTLVLASDGTGVITNHDDSTRGDLTWKDGKEEIVLTLRENQGEHVVTAKLADDRRSLVLTINGAQTIPYTRKP